MKRQSNLKHVLGSEEGFTLVLVILLMTSLTALGIVSIMSSVVRSQFAHHSKDHNRTLYVADMGTSAALQQLREQPPRLDEIQTSVGTEGEEYDPMVRFDVGTFASGPQGARESISNDIHPNPISFDDPPTRDIVGTSTDLAHAALYNFTSVGALMNPDGVNVNTSSLRVIDVVASRVAPGRKEIHDYSAY